MTQTGAGIWVAYKGTSILQLYHIETMRHIQDQNIKAAVNKIFPDMKEESISVTCMIVTRGLLWIGTNVGVIMTLDLPRLEGVPVVTGRPCLSYHAQNGPIKFLMPISCDLIPISQQPTPQVSVCSSNGLEDSTSEDLTERRTTVSFDLDNIPVNRSSSATGNEQSFGLAASKKFVSTPNITTSDYDDINSLYSCLMGGENDYESEFFSSLKGFDGPRHTGYMTIQTAKVDDIKYRKNLNRQHRQRKAQSVSASFGTTKSESLYEPVKVSKTKSPKLETKRVASLTESTPKDENTKTSEPKRGTVKKMKGNQPSSVIIVSGGNGYYNRISKETERERMSEDPRLLMWLTKTD